MLGKFIKVRRAFRRRWVGHRTNLFLITEKVQLLAAIKLSGQIISLHCVKYLISQNNDWMM